MSARILVLDAEPVVSSVITDILESGGYLAESVATLKGAIAILKSAPPDLVITNVYLPGITGRDAVRLLKRTRPQLPVLMVSGLPDSEVIREWAGKDGFDTFPKPFTAQDLLGKVRSILKANGSG
jgi:DNA-binding response OmpR family regulator